MTKKMLFLVNPKAGNGEIAGKLLDVVTLFTQGGYRVTVHPTSDAGEIPSIIAQQGNRYDIIVSSGGDGTFNETVSGMMQLEQHPLLGYLPAGTCNDLAASLGIPANPISAAKTILNGVPMEMDVGSFNQQWFAYVAGFGALTDVPYTTTQHDKKYLGRMAYLLNGVKSLGDIRPINVAVDWDHGHIEDSILVGLVSSTTSVGGFKTKKSDAVCLNDGLYEVVLVKNIKNILDYPAVAAALLRRDFTDPRIHSFQTKHIQFAFDRPISWTLDGEFGGVVTNVSICNHQKALTIMTPK